MVVFQTCLLIIAESFVCLKTEVKRKFLSKNHHEIMIMTLLSTRTATTIVGQWFYIRLPKFINNKAAVVIVQT